MNSNSNNELGLYLAAEKKYKSVNQWHQDFFL